MRKAIIVALYLLAIAGANVLTARFAPIALGNMLVPVGTLLIGCTFILRDLVQTAVGRSRTYAAIAAAMLLSALTSYVLGDTMWITFASAATFLVSETTDTEIFTRLKGSFAWKVLVSGVAGGLVDSALFVLIGLSPLGAGILPWEAVGNAILGQVLVKTALQCLGAALARPLLERVSIFPSAARDV